MKKLFIYFVLVSSFLCGVGGASSNNPMHAYSKEITEWALKVGPEKAISQLFEEDFKNNDYRQKDRIFATPRTIFGLYPRHPELQKKAVETWGRCMKNQTVNGRRKYSDQDVDILVNFSKSKLGLN